MSIGIDFVRYTLSIGALELVPNGRQLKSKRISPYFFNTGLFNTGSTAGRLAASYAEMLYQAQQDLRLASDSFDVVFGPAYKGVPLAVSIAIALSAKYPSGFGNIGFAFNRKEEKDHGEGGIIVGASLAGRRAVIVDDVMTSGKSSNEAVSITRIQGGTVVGAALAFDRMERGVDESGLSATQAFTKNYGAPVFAVATLDDLIAHLQVCAADYQGGVEALPRILAYKEEYGV